MTSAWKGLLGSGRWPWVRLGARPSNYWPWDTWSQSWSQAAGPQVRAGGHARSGPVAAHVTPRFSAGETKATVTKVNKRGQQWTWDRRSPPALVCPRVIHTQDRSLGHLRQHPQHPSVVLCPSRTFFCWPSLPAPGRWTSCLGDNRPQVCPQEKKQPSLAPSQRSPPPSLSTAWD